MVFAIYSSSNEKARKVLGWDIYNILSCAGNEINNIAKIC
jgi:hypothetical protein